MATDLNLDPLESGTVNIPTSLARLGNNLLPGGVEEKIRAAGGSVSKPPQGEEADPYWAPTISIPGMTKQQATDWLISQPEFYSTGEFTPEDVRAAEAGNITPGYAKAVEIATTRGNADSNNAWYDKLFKTIAQYGGIVLAGGTYAGLLEGAGAADAVGGGMASMAEQTAINSALAETAGGVTGAAAGTTAVGSTGADLLTTGSAVGEGVTGDYSLAELANIAGGGEAGLTAGSLAPATTSAWSVKGLIDWANANQGAMSLLSGVGQIVGGIGGGLLQSSMLDKKIAAEREMAEMNSPAAKIQAEKDKYKGSGYFEQPLPVLTPTVKRPLRRPDGTLVYGPSGGLLANQMAK